MLYYSLFYLLLGTKYVTKYICLYYVASYDNWFVYRGNIYIFSFENESYFVITKKPINVSHSTSYVVFLI